jgi:hypothetical protein
LAQKLEQTPVNLGHKIGRHILAQYDDQSVIIYQAYCPAIVNFAVYQSYFDFAELITAHKTV